MSEAPPGAVLMTNSTGFVGVTTVTPVAPADVPADAPPPAPPHADATSSPAIASEIDRPKGLRIRCDLPLLVRQALPKGSLVRPRSKWSDRRHRRPGGRAGARRWKYACEMG